MKTIELLQKILFYSNTEHCESAEDMQYHLNIINELITTHFPNLKELQSPEENYDKT